MTIYASSGKPCFCAASLLSKIITIMPNGKSFFSQLVNGGFFTNILDKGLDFGEWALKSNILYKQQQQLAEDAYNRQLDFWNKQNAYNDPSNQVNRFMAAGLNPAMLNGNAINNTAGGLSSVPTPSPLDPSVSKSSVAANKNLLSQILVNDKQLGFIDAQTRHLAESILNLIVEREIKTIAKQMGMTESEIRNLDKVALFEAYYGTGIDGGEFTIKNNPYSVQMAEGRARILLDESQSALNSMNTQLAQSSLETAKAMLPLLIDAKKAETAEAKSRIAKNIAETQLIPYMQREIEQRIKESDSRILLIGSQEILNNAQRAKITEETIQLLDSREFNLMLKSAGASEAQANAAIAEAKKKVSDVTLRNVSGETNFLDAITSTVDALVYSLVNSK